MNNFRQIAREAFQPLADAMFVLREDEGMRGIDLVFLEKEGREFRIAYERFCTPALHRFRGGEMKEMIPVPFEVSGGEGGTLQATHEEQLMQWCRAAVGVVLEMEESANRVAGAITDSRPHTTLLLPTSISDLRSKISSLANIDEPFPSSPES